MGKKTLKTNFRVEVVPRHPGDLGLFGFYPDHSDIDKEQEKKCKDIAEQIRMHINRLPSNYSSKDRGVSVICDTQAVCEFCGYSWGEDNDSYNGGCCDKDELGGT